MSSKIRQNFFTPQKLLLLFLTFFAIQSIMLLFLALRPFDARAQARAGGLTGEGQQDCPCLYDKKGTNKIDTTRLYIPIPGVTDACGWVCDINDDARGDIADYIITVYKLLVGIAAVVAFAMIVYAGYEWIFAMGNSGKIDDAKERIMSACIGLALALVSVQFLQALNPQLTNISLPDVTKIARASLNPFCRDTDIVFGVDTMKELKDKDYVVDKTRATKDKASLTCPSEFTIYVRIEGDKAYCYSNSIDECWGQITEKFANKGDQSVTITGTDGQPITLTQQSIIPYDPKSAPKCQGTFCSGSDKEQVCYPSDPYARAFECKSAKSACEDTNDNKNGCEEVNNWLAYQGYTDQQCAKIVKTAQQDACILGKLLKCPPDYPNQMKGDDVFRNLVKDICWEAKGQSEAVLKDCGGFGVKIYPVLDGNAVQGANALCCRKPSTQESETDYSCVTNYMDRGNTVVELLSIVQQVTIPPNTPGHYFGHDCNEGTAYLLDKEGTDCHILGFYPDAYDVLGTCQKKEGENGDQGTVTRGVCVPKDETLYGGFKVCWGDNPYQQINNNYNNYNLCLKTEKEAYKCNPYLLSSGISCIGETPASPPQVNTNNVINTEIEIAIETVVNSNTTLKNNFSNQQIGFQSKPQFFSANTAFAAEKIDACTFVQAVVDQESDGKVDAWNGNKNDKGQVVSVDCGLMGINIPNGTDKNSCEQYKDTSDLDQDGNLDENLFDPGFNIATGVQKINSWFSPSICGDGTSCKASQSGRVDGNKFYRYAMAGYNGGTNANKKSGGDDQFCSIDESGANKCCASPCKDYQDECFITATADDIYPTQVECPNDRGKYQGTYDYVFNIEELYKALKNKNQKKDGDGIASCP